MRVRACVIGSAIATASLLAVFPAPAVRADIVVTPGPSPVVLEGTRNIPIQFSVRNTDTFDRILDFALATIGPASPDPLDSIVFSGVNGDRGLTSAAGIIPAGQTVNFIYSVDAIDDPAPDVDFGRSTVSFFIETTMANPNRTPNLIPLPQAAGIVFVDQSKPGSTQPNPAVLANLINNLTPPPPGLPPGSPLLLYSDPTSAEGTPYPATLTVTSLDVPEPSGVLLLGLGVLGLLGSSCRVWPGRARGTG